MKHAKKAYLWIVFGLSSKGRVPEASNIGWHPVMILMVCTGHTAIKRYPVVVLLFWPGLKEESTFVWYRGRRCSPTTYQIFSKFMDKTTEVEEDLRENYADGPYIEQQLGLTLYKQRSTAAMTHHQTRCSEEYHNKTSYLKARPCCQAALLLLQWRWNMHHHSRFTWQTN